MKKMERDFLTDLGFISFVTRLKRVSDAMLHDGRRLYKELGMDIEPNWFVVFKLLEKNGEMTVTEIAEQIGFAHPSVISIVNKMTRAGYLESRPCENDSRRRLLVMTDKAKRNMPEFERVWQAGVTGVKKMLADTDALDFLASLEQKINDKGFKERTLKSLAEQREVEILEFDERFAGDFARLNYEWIEQWYEVEEHDREQLDHPVEHIIAPGGRIFFARIENEIVGTVALIELNEDSFELAKMAVTSRYRGYGIGEKLMAACIEGSRDANKKSIILESNTRQIPAIKLYEKYGFHEIPLDPNTPYARANIRMELIL
jgi:DNA-binding MarR family transcriptional regulator/ribosomal protein S18 acetylase RimI-like enzyme